MLHANACTPPKNIDAALLFVLSLATTCCGQFDYNQLPVDYDNREPVDRVHVLAKQLSGGKLELEWNDQHGWLPSVLKALDVPSKSQTLVFSKTSQQIRHIDPAHPRALYFNSSVYVGWVQGAEFIELAAVDPEQGAIFYALKQSPNDRPAIRRDSGQCLSCHSTARTGDVPGFLVRSAFVKPDGHPEFRLGTTTTDHTIPFFKRFGGWYVTGTHGEMRHRGNVLLSDNADAKLDRESGANRNTLPPIVNANDYLEPGSDIVALMLLEHQTQFHNRVTRASYETRQALHYQSTMNKALGRDPEHETDSTRRRIDRAAENLVMYLLFSNEFPLTDPVRGNPEFAKQFVAGGTKDSQGRSLWQLDLKTRLLKYRCSYLIYSPSFQALPEPVLTLVIKRMHEVLTGRDDSDEFAHLSADDRAAILEILSDTHSLFRSKATDR